MIVYNHKSLYTSQYREKMACLENYLVSKTEACISHLTHFNEKYLKPTDLKLVLHLYRALEDYGDIYFIEDNDDDWSSIEKDDTDFQLLDFSDVSGLYFEENESCYFFDNEQITRGEQQNIEDEFYQNKRIVLYGWLAKCIFQAGINPKEISIYINDYDGVGIDINETYGKLGFSLEKLQQLSDIEHFIMCIDTRKNIDYAFLFADKNKENFVEIDLCKKQKQILGGLANGKIKEPDIAHKVAILEGENLLQWAVKKANELLNEGFELVDYPKDFETISISNFTLDFNPHNENGKNIVQLEKELNITLPEFYKAYIRINNGLEGDTRSHSFDVENGFYSNIETLFGVHPNNPKFDIRTHYSEGSHFLPIGFDAYQNYILLGIKPYNLGQVFYQYRYSQSIDYQKIVFLSKDFETFLKYCTYFYQPYEEVVISSGNSKRLIECFENLGINPDKKIGEYSLINLAIRSGHLENVQLLHERYDISFKPIFDDFPYTSPEVMEYLLAKSDFPLSQTFLNQQLNNFVSKYLHNQEENAQKNFAIVEKMLSLGADPHAPITWDEKSVYEANLDNNENEIISKKVNHLKSLFDTLPKSDSALNNMMKTCQNLGVAFAKNTFSLEEVEKLAQKHEVSFPKTYQDFLQICQNGNIEKQFSEQEQGRSKQFYVDIETLFSLPQIIANYADFQIVKKD